MIKNNTQNTRLYELVSDSKEFQDLIQGKLIVYDFIPIVLGNQFRTNETLSKMLLRDPPVRAPFMLQTEAYELLGLKYVNNNDLIPALECYRIALGSRTDFMSFVGSFGGNALVSENELDHMVKPTELETKLLTKHKKSNKEMDVEEYSTWVQELREASKNHLHLNHTDYGSKDYVEACLKIGHYKEALHHARELKDNRLVGKIRRKTPDEILDISFLNRFINDNHPESSLFG